MKIIVAMDSFKGSLSSVVACDIVARAIVAKKPGVDIVVKPLADGGEGTAKVLMDALGGQWISKKVVGALPDMEVEAGFAWFENEKMALVEMALASGLELLSENQKNPLETTTYGTGELIKAAIEYGAQKILLAVGGSATVDGGVGGAMALGWRFLDSNGESIPLGGIGLTQICNIIKPDGLDLPEVEVLCDVNNPLCGELGAASIYGPQKGATPQMVEELENGMKNLAEMVKKKLNCDIDTPGAGAAGGLAGGAVAFMDAKLVSGIETVMQHINISKEIETADWIITGEGCFDSQSLHGKVVSGIAKLAGRSRARVAVLAGDVKLTRQEYSKEGISEAIGAKTTDMMLEYALSNSEKLLTDAASRLADKIILCCPHNGLNANRKY
jgi:glycerate 2-kinase